MISNWKFLFRQLSRQLWFTSGLYSLLGVITALSALWLNPLLPADLTTKIGADAVDRILGILASSMLAVTTFSIATMVSAYSAAANGATPRATRLLVEDRTAQAALSTFLGAFLFSIVSIVALATGAYGENGRVLLFFVTIGVIVLIVLMLLRWIDKVSRLGRVAETIDEVERAASRAMRDYARGAGEGVEIASSNVSGAVAVYADGGDIGYIQNIDMPRLVTESKTHGITIALAARAGAFVTPIQPLAFLPQLSDRKILESLEKAVRAAVTIGDTRSYDQDPRFGLIVLSEIAARALSPAVNDAGTAIDVIGTAVRVLSVIPRQKVEEAESKRQAVKTHKEDDNGEPRGRVLIEPIKPADFFDDIFVPIARDGAAFVEIAVHLQKALHALAVMDPEFAEVARVHSRFALARAEAAMTLDDDKRRAKAAAAWH